MPNKQHTYTVEVEWTGNLGTGTSSYRGYTRDHTISAAGKQPILGSSDPAFRGDKTRWNPEEMLLAAIATCHQLWYLHLCSDAGIVLVGYRDTPIATMAEHADGSGEFVSATLRPHATLAPGSDADLALRLHDKAAAMCFVARSLNFTVGHAPTVAFA